MDLFDMVVSVVCLVAVAWLILAVKILKYIRQLIDKVDQLESKIENLASSSLVSRPSVKAKAMPAVLKELLQKHQEDMIYTTASGKNFHRLGCHYLDRDAKPVGYAPCCICFKEKKL